MKRSRFRVTNWRYAYLILGVVLLCGLMGSAASIGPPGLLAQQQIPCSGDLTGLEPGIDYEAGRVILFIREDQKEIGESIFDASQKGSLTTGIEDFDSIGATFKLEGLFSAQEYSPFYRRKFYLVFPHNADIGLITSTYCELTYVELAGINGYISIDTAIALNSWANIKKTFQRDGKSGDENGSFEK